MRTHQILRKDLSSFSLIRQFKFVFDFAIKSSTHNFTKNFIFPELKMWYFYSLRRTSFHYWQSVNAKRQYSVNCRFIRQTMYNGAKEKKDSFFDMKNYQSSILPLFLVTLEKKNSKKDRKTNKRTHTKSKFSFPCHQQSLGIVTWK